MSEGHYDIAFYSHDLMLMEKWYVKNYGLADIEPPLSEKNLYEKIIVIRKNEQYLESLEDFGTEKV